ncbi:hypothetical protein ACN38_g258 [Penicillium nordicum]|uniref:Histone h1.3 n=1 Tax=Penicillium nordicum TaxID=229535 RepID=A0A0M8PJ44_9EURO|nr:hypothetical protein ACN38_g258 [Penicillium nordicum]
MSSPAKLDSQLAELKPAEARLLLCSTVCSDGKIDFEKLAAMTGMKKNSANTNYLRAKKHLEQIMNGNPLSPTQAAGSQSEQDGDAGAPDAGAPKAGRSGKRGAAKDASTKNSEPAKRRKTESKPESKTESKTKTGTKTVSGLAKTKPESKPESKTKTGTKTVSGLANRRYISDMVSCREPGREWNESYGGMN